MRVAIAGGGVAAACCAHLLAQRRIATQVVATPRRGAPVVMLSAAAVALLRDVLDRRDLFAHAPRITRRIVAWGGNAPLAMPHDAIVVTADALAELMPAGSMSAPQPADLTIRTAAHPTEPMQRFGTRDAAATTVRLTDPGAAQDCWIESLDAGWLFLIPLGSDGDAWLLSVGISIDEALDRSRHVAPCITIGEGPVARFDPAPRLAARATGDDWLVCGSAAIAFDPIAGDGTAQAVRAAILAAAVVGGIAQGGNAAALKAHYAAMLTAAMRRHLQLCAPFYRSGGIGPWWRTAHDTLATGYDACTRQLAVTPPPRYVLHGHDLVAREQVA